MDEIELGGTDSSGLRDSERSRGSDFGGDSSDSPRGGIVTARGTGDGLILRLDGRIDASTLKAAIIDFINGRKGFLTGNPVALEWVGVLPARALIDEVSALLESQFSIKVRSSSLWTPGRIVSIAEEEPVKGRTSSKSASQPTRIESIRGKDTSSSSKGSASTGRAPSLFDGIEVFNEVIEEQVFAEETPNTSKARGLERVQSGGRAAPVAGSIGFDSALWDEADARVIHATLRSGQKIETEHSLIIFGDVNSGAEVIAGGDILVLGNLRGIAHAGAYDETGGGRVIFALNLQPTQLRIGMTISRGSSEGGAVPEMARVDGSLIVVEPYSARVMAGRRR